MPGEAGSVGVGALFRQLNGEHYQQHSRQRGGSERDGTGQEAEHGRACLDAPALLHRTGRESTGPLVVNLHSQDGSGLAGNFLCQLAGRSTETI